MITRTRITRVLFNEERVAAPPLYPLSLPLLLFPQLESNRQMAVHHSRRRGPLPSDIEFSSLDSISSGHSLVELAFLNNNNNNNDRDRRTTSGSSSQRKPGDLEIVPLVKLDVIHGLDGVSFCPSTYSLCSMKSTDRGAVTWITGEG